MLKTGRLLISPIVLGDSPPPFIDEMREVGKGYSEFQ
jgi:hypothetical protein